MFSFKRPLVFTASLAVISCRAFIINFTTILLNLRAKICSIFLYTFIQIHMWVFMQTDRKMRVLSTLTGQQAFIKLNKCNIISMNYNIQTYNIENISFVWNVTIYNFYYYFYLWLAFYGLHF